MKRILAIIMTIIIATLSIVGLSGCGRSQAEMQAVLDANKTTNEADSIPDISKSPNGKYEVALCASEGQLKDRGFNEFCLNGVKQFASSNNKTYKYYLPGTNPSADEYANCIKAAIDNGAKSVVTVSFGYGPVMEKAARDNPDVKFVWIDGWTIEGCDNIAAICFKEQEAGYMCGYAVVKEGLTRLGFCGGGGGSTDAVNKYGRGYVQGAEAAARELGVTIEMIYSYQYGSSFSSSPELQAMTNAWYDNGTQVIFSCGGAMFDSIASSAVANDAYVIGADSDASARSSSVLTSALKKVDVVTTLVLQLAYDGEWEYIGGTTTTLGASDNAVGLPTDSWRFKNFTIEEYNKLYDEIVSGERDIETDINNNKSTEYMIYKPM